MLGDLLLNRLMITPRARERQKNTGLCEVALIQWPVLGWAVFRRSLGQA